MALIPETLVILPIQQFLILPLKITLLGFLGTLIYLKVFNSSFFCENKLGNLTALVFKRSYSSLIRIVDSFFE